MSAAGAVPAPHYRGRMLCIIWLYLVAAGHFLVGMLLPWLMDAAWFEAYHQAIEHTFWQGAAPASARSQQVWWIGLFGPTVQAVAIWMAALIRLGQLHGGRFAWLMLIVGLLIWAPQDIAFSLRADAWSHVWIDLFAVGVTLPPLLWLYWRDGRAAPREA